MKALIFDIKRFAIHDGPGIRTTVFFKGCPLSCLWCHNPESKRCYPEDYIKNEKIGDKTFKIKKTVGKYYSEDTLMIEVLKDKAFYEELGGGITCSGGEPLYQYKFLKSFLKLCKENGLHTVVDTSGYASWDTIKQLLPYTDLFLYDIKHLDNLSHQKYTGIENTLILQNLKNLINSRSEVVARFPLIPGINNDTHHLLKIKDFLKSLKSRYFHKVHVLPYHKTGNGKYRKFNLTNYTPFLDPTSVEIEKASDILKESNFQVSIGG